MTEPKWVPYGALTGWMYEGTVEVRQLGGGDFWARAVRVVAAAEGGKVDMVQCYDPGIMTAGPLGATARFGTLAKLLGNLPLVLLQRYLGDVFESVGMGLRMAPAEPAFTLGLRTVTASDELRRVFLGGSDGVNWSPAQKALAERWVRGLAALLADTGAYRSITQASIATLRGYLPASAAAKLGWPTSGVQEPPNDAQIRRSTACWLAFAINNPAGAMRLLNVGTTAEAMLAAAQQNPGGVYPRTFPQRVARTRRALDAEVWS